MAPPPRLRVWADAALAQGARMLRQLHDASIGFPLDDAVWQSPSKVPVEVVCHNDFSPHNLAFRDGAIVGAIDFDMCSPGPRIWDLAYYATRMVPLTSEPPAGAPAGDEVRRRIDLLLDAYGRDAGSVPLTADAVVQVAIRRLYEIADFSREKADELGKPELRDHATDYERNAGHLSRAGVSEQTRQKPRSRAPHPTPSMEAHPDHREARRWPRTTLEDSPPRSGRR